MGTTYNEGLMNAIKALQMIQSDILDSNTRLTDPQVVQTAVLCSDFQNLSNQVSDLKVDNSSLLNGIEFLRTRITNIESASDNQHFTTPYRSMTQITERDKRFHNIFVHGLQ